MLDLTTLGFSELAADAARPAASFAAPVDSAISPDQAGKAYASLVDRGRATVLAARRGRTPVPAHLRITGDGWFGADPGLFRGSPVKGYAAFVFSGLDGLSADQRAALSALVQAVPASEFSIVARAPSVPMYESSAVEETENDVPGRLCATSVDPGESALFLSTCVTHRYTSVNLAVASRHAAAALALEGREYAKAETILREVIAFGFQLMRNARTWEDYVPGPTIVSSARQALDTLYRATGRHRESARLGAGHADSLSRRSTATRETIRVWRLQVDGTASRYLTAVIGDTGLIPARRWAALDLARYRACTSLGQMLSGSDEYFNGQRHWVAQDSLSLLTVDGDAELLQRIDSALVLSRGPRTFPQRVRPDPIAAGLRATAIYRVASMIATVLGIPSVDACGRFAARYLSYR
jgi:hypothetical protein